MRALGKNVLKTAVLVIVFWQLAGCASVIAKAVLSDVLSSYPTFESTEQTWPALSDEMGRVVFYFPGRTLGEAALIGGAISGVELGIDGDESKWGRVGSETFVFVDLTPGKHNINFIHCGSCWVPRKLTMSVDVRAGEFIYVKIKQFFISWDPPVIVGAEEARKALKEFHHNYKDPVPFTQQKKEAVPAT